MNQRSRTAREQQAIWDEAARNHRRGTLIDAAQAYVDFRDTHWPGAPLYCIPDRARPEEERLLRELVDAACAVREDVEGA